MTDDLWDRVMDVNLKSVYLVSRAVLPIMRRQGRGGIINMTSIAAPRRRSWLDRFRHGPRRRKHLTRAMAENSSPITSS